MALVLKDNRDYNLLKRYIVEPESAPYPPAFELRIANQNLAAGIETFTLETGDNGAMILDATLSERLPVGIAQSPIQAIAYIGGIPIPIFAGRLAKPRVSTTSTQIFGRSGATYLEDSKLGSGLAAAVPALFYRGTASKLIRDAVRASLIYSRGNIKVEKIDKIIDFMAADLAMSPSQTVRDLLSLVAEEAKCVYRDTPIGPLGTFEAFRDPRLGNPRDAVIEIEATEESDWTHETDDEQMFYDVVVDKPAEPDAEPPVQGFRVRKRVPYNSYANLPPYTVTDWIEVSDDDGITSRAQARKLCSDVAKMRAKQTETVSITTAYNPILQKYDVFTVGENVQVRGGKRRYEWTCVIDSKKDDSKTMTSSFEATGRITNNTFFEDPPDPIRLPSVSVVSSRGSALGGAGEPVERDTRGLLLYPLRSGDPPWIVRDPENGLEIYPERSAGHAYRDGAGNFVINRYV